MVLLDSIIFGNLSYVIIGNALRYYKNKDAIDSEIKTLHGETEIIHIADFTQHRSTPMYVNTGFPGVMLPLRDNSSNEKTIMSLLRNGIDNYYVPQGTSDFSDKDKYKITYLNNDTEVKKFIHCKGIDSDSLPITYPLKVYHRLHCGSVTTPMYHNNCYYNTSRNSIKLAINLNRR